MESWIRVCLVTGAALAWTAAQADAPSRPLVVELFTAQGCSSCPPADAYLGQLSERPDVLALAFHRAPVFTPQFVIDGRKDAMDTSSIVQALQEPRDAVPVTLAVREGQVVVDVGEKQGERPSDVVLVAFLRHATSNVGRGENAGKTLEEFNIVRSIRTLGEWKGATENYKVSVSSLPSDATDVAVLVQSRGEGPMVGAASQSLR